MSVVLSSNSNSCNQSINQSIIYFTDLVGTVDFCFSGICLCQKRDINVYMYIKIYIFK